MQDIHGSSSKINDIIGVIDGIAFQTNILALNAAVAVSYTHLDVYKRQAHGRHDTVVVPQRGTASRDALLALGLSLIHI